ncbi:hypothetical protein Gohar_010672 [Gossypium harknessii]|uniref:Uncharacterized protein n=1 Tax=Gossypium harknessii TaxID=34285 RepID=A0A7J9GT16_9ROSI|nr:hypothetical protein [Gossypium harknessii]
MIWLTFRKRKKKRRPLES